MTIKEAKEIIEKKKKCNEFYEQGTKGRCYSFYVTCGNCSYYVDSDKYNEACNIAKESLEAWEKVIERLTKMANDKWNEQVGSSKGLNDAIEVIEDILSEVEDEQTERKSFNRNPQR